jgi:hypothetical protein
MATLGLRDWPSETFQNPYTLCPIHPAVVSRDEWVLASMVA